MAKRAILALALGVSVSFGSAASRPETRGQFLSQVLRGSPLTPKDPLTYEVIQALREGRDRDAGILLMKHPNFVNISVRHWAALLVSNNAEPLAPLDDMVSLAVGAVKDDLDARELLTGDFTYGPSLRFGGGRPLPSTNHGYDELDRRQTLLHSDLVRYEPQWERGSSSEAAGILTTRGWARRYYSAGTNRRAVPQLLAVFLCRETGYWKTPNLSTRRIRQDVSRAPQGDPRIFQTDCRHCHAPMDGLAGAFSLFDFQDEVFKISQNVVPKYLQNPSVYPEGYVTRDDSWENLLTTSQGASFGWRGAYRSGKGARELGRMISESEGFSRCLVTRVAQHLCGKVYELSDPWIEGLRKDFEARDRYRLRQLWLRVLLDERCENDFQAASVGMNHPEENQ